MVDIEQLSEDELYWEDWLDREEWKDAIKNGFTNMSFDMWKISKFVCESIWDNIHKEDKR